MRAELTIIILITGILVTMRLPPPTTEPPATAAVHYEPQQQTTIAAMRPALGPSPYPLWIWPWGVLSTFVVVCCLYLTWWLRKEGFLPF
jgi:hypothetical protein